MVKIVMNDCVYFVHPIYNLYAGSKDGNIIHILKQVPIKSNKNNVGYITCMVRKHGQTGQKSLQVHRFIYECFNGVIPYGKEIDHINNKRDDNRLCNLQLLTPKENRKKSVENRDYSFLSQIRKNKKSVKATNINTNEVSYFNSLYAVKQHIGIDYGIVKKV